MAKHLQLFKFYIWNITQTLKVKNISCWILFNGYCLKFVEVFKSLLLRALNVYLKKKTNLVWFYKFLITFTVPIPCHKNVKKTTSKSNISGFVRSCVMLYFTLCFFYRISVGICVCDYIIMSWIMNFRHGIHTFILNWMSTYLMLSSTSKS